MKKKGIILSGIQPTGNLHIGNYLGAIKNWVALQESGEYECFFSIVDLHSLTGNMDAEARRAQITKTAIELLAAGIDPEKSTIFIQSTIPEHTELAWIFNTLTPIAELERMTQFKDKSEDQAKNINAGLLTYPVLQAADILLPRATHVPVGEDQVQHVELTRATARWFNNRYGDFFVEPEALLTEIPRVKSLLKPEKKMSKSLGEGHVIELADAPDVIEKKIKKAVTASEGGETAPGVQNLLLLLEHFAPKEVQTTFVQAEQSGDIRYGDLKAAVSTHIADAFAEFRERRTALMNDHDMVAAALAAGEEKMAAIASETMQEVRRRIGIR